MYPSERVEQKKQMVAFDKMVAKSTGSLDVIREFFKDDKQWGRLVSLVRISYSYPSVADPGKFREAAGSARQNDTSGLKHKLDYVLSDATQALVPKLSDSASKSDRAHNHPMLRDAIIPWPLRLAIHEKEVLPEDAPEDAEPSPTPAAVAFVNICAYIHTY
jgi:hypothetical protein